MSIKFKPYLIISLILGSTSIHADSLNAVIQRSIQMNPNVLSYRENRLSINHAVDQAKAGYYPSLRATASYGPQKSKNPNTIATLANGTNSGNQWVTMPEMRSGLELRQNVFAGFETKGEVARNKARANSAGYQLLANIQDTAYNIAQYYIEVLQERELVRIAEANVRAHRSLNHMIGSRTKAGLSNDADFVQTQGRVALAESQLAAERNNLQDAIARYKTVTGEYPQDLQLPSDIPDSVLPRSEQEAIASAIVYYPVVKAARSDVVQACEQHEVAKAPNYPRIDILANLNRNLNEGGLRGPTYDEGIFLQASYDIFAGGKYIGRERETAHLYKQASDIMDNSVRQAKENAKIAWDYYYTSRKVLPMLRRHSETTRNTVTAYQSQFTLGKRTLFDRLDVQNELYNARRDYVAGKYKILTAKYRLLHSMGILLQVLHISLPEEVNPTPI